MQNTFMSFLLIIMALTSVNAIAQNANCIERDRSQQELYLDGKNFTLIDNALRCFKLNSVANSWDSLVRIWVLDEDFPDSPTTCRVKMFEFGKKEDVPFAKLHLLEWNYKESDSSLPIKCIKQTKVYPEYGWVAFERNIRRLNLPELYKKPFPNRGYVIVDNGLFVIQFLFGNTTYTVDITQLVNLTYTVNALQSDHSNRITYLFGFIEKHFLINLSVDPKGRDFLEDAKKRLKINWPSSPVK